MITIGYKKTYVFFINSEQYPINKNNGLSNFELINMEELLKNKNITTRKDSIFSKVNTVSCIDLDNEGLLVSKDKFAKKYIANTTTMAIWDLLDGYRTAQDIAQEIADVCEVPVVDIEQDIYQQIATFKELGFIEEAKTESFA